MFNAALADKKKYKPYNKIKSQVYNELDSFTLYIRESRNRLILKKDKLKKEISSVKRTTAKLGGPKVITGQRIDIAT